MSLEINSNTFPSFGVALSVYNKVREIQTNVNIIRKVWPFPWNSVVITVCCNDPESFKEINKLSGVDIVIAGSDIPSAPKPNLRRRQFDCISKSMQSNLSSYVIHWHADAFALNPLAIDNIVQEMQSKNMLCAFRGRGLDYRSQKNIFGDVDDHFFVLSSACKSFFSFDPAVELKSCNVESILSKRINDICEKNCLWYSDMSSNIVGTNLLDDFYSDGIQHRAMNPFNVDESRMFIHCQTQELIKSKLRQYGIDDEFISF